MKLKSGLLLICIIICLFTIASASAGEVNDAVMVSEDDSQIEISQINEITQDNAQTNGEDTNNPEASSKSTANW
jgi:hypothetical protein